VVARYEVPIAMAAERSLGDEIDRLLASAGRTNGIGGQEEFSDYCSGEFNGLLCEFILMAFVVCSHRRVVNLGCLLEWREEVLMAFIVGGNGGGIAVDQTGKEGRDGSCVVLNQFNELVCGCQEFFMVRAVHLCLGLDGGPANVLVA